MMARSGQVRLARVRVPTIRGRRSAEWVVIGRPEVGPGHDHRRAMQTAAIRRVEAAGTIAGAWFASPATRQGHELIAAGLLLIAGPVDGDSLLREVRTGYEGRQTSM